MVTWTLLTDTDDDGLFDDTDILSVDVYSIQIHHGYTGELSRMAEPGTATIICKNFSSDFYPESASPHALRAGRWMQVKAVVSLTYKVFTGILRSIRRIDHQFVELRLDTRLHGLNQSIEIPMFEDTLVSDIVDYIFIPNNLELVHPLNDSVTGLPFAYIDFCDIDDCVIFDALPPLLSIDTSESTLPWYGGIMDGNQTGQKHLNNLLAAEWGWLYEDRDGTIRFRNRHTTLIDTTVQRTFTDVEMADFQYSYGDNIISRVEASATPRLREERTIWTAEAPRRIDDGITSHTLRFLASDGRVMGLATGSIPALDFSYENVLGTARTDVLATIDRVLDNGVQVRFEYPGGGARFLSAGSEMTATALVQQTPVDVEAEIGAWQTFKRSIKIDGLETAEVDLATGICNFVLQENKEARGRVDSIKLNANTAAAFDLDLLDLVRVNSSSTGHNEIYRVVGWDYDWTAGAGIVDYRLRPDAGENYIVIDVTGRNLINTGSIAL
jgi:hypothetical protein